jgi:MoaA/NifB/PqqE/SkfB family radical SAM enzyme
VNTVSNFVKNRGELKFAFIQVTTRCNARCTDRCNIWACEPFDMPLENVKFAIDVLAKNNFSILYLTGGETGLYPYLVEAVDYAKSKGMITSLTTNGSISEVTLRRLSRNLDILSISIDHYDEKRWDAAKNVAGISRVAQKTVEIAKNSGMKLYGITFLNPSWTVEEVKRTVDFVNGELGISFALSYPYFSCNEGTFVVGGDLCPQNQAQLRVRNMVAKVLEMKLNGADVATVSGYMKDVLRTHDGLPMRYHCNAGRSVLTIDCNLDVFPCYKRHKFFNLKDCQNLNFPPLDVSLCDNKDCLINCFKEASLASRHAVVAAVTEELFSNPRFYLKMLH